MGGEEGGNTWLITTWLRNGESNAWSSGEYRSLGEDSARLPLAGVQVTAARSNGARVLGL